MLGHSSSLTFFIYIYKSQIHVSTDIIINVLFNMFTWPLNLYGFVALDISRNGLYLSYFYY